MAVDTLTIPQNHNYIIKMHKQVLISQLSSTKLKVPKNPPFVATKRKHKKENNR